jgi:hypothetical protein
MLPELNGRIAYTIEKQGKIQIPAVVQRYGFLD